jgi:hypothetical protein
VELLDRDSRPYLTPVSGRAWVRGGTWIMWRNYLMRANGSTKTFYAPDLDYAFA